MTPLSLNWVDIGIILVLVYFIYQGFVGGFWVILIDFVSFFGALMISLKIYPWVAPFLEKNFSLSMQMSLALGYLLTAVVAEMILDFVLTYLISRLPKKILKNHISRILGVVLSLGQGILLTAFILTLIIALPVNPTLKQSIADSNIGGIILTKTSGIENKINSIFGGAINETLTYLTVEPGSNETVLLSNTTNNLSIDEASERKMFELLNKERTSRGLAALSESSELKTIARDYGRYMWEQHYFGHYDSAGHDVAYRLQQAGVSYMFAGENLALAPTVDLAHTGLMNSAGHRANILDINYGKVGIGVVDNGFYGKIFVQEFTD